MRRLILILAFLVIAVWFGLEVVRHPGYVFILYQPWMVQMPVWFALLSFFVLLGFLYVLIDSIDRLQFWWFKVKNWFRFRRQKQFYSKTQQGLATLIEARWKKAEHLLLAGMNQSAEPLINYLAAAKAAYEQGARDRCDNYIQKAYRVAPHAKLAIGLVQAELDIQNGQFEQAAATLNHLRQLSPRHPRVLQLLEKVYVHLADWSHLQALLPSMRKAKMLRQEQFEQFEKNLYCELFRAAKHKKLYELQQIWDDIPRAMRKNPEVALAYVIQLQRFTDTKDIEEVVRKTLKSYWQPQLAAIYGRLPFTNLNRQLVIVGAWLKMYGEKAELLLTLGNLCARLQLWGKAKDYFERCLALGPNAEASLEYGKLLERLGNSEDAMRQFRDGLARLAEFEKQRTIP